MSLCTLRQTAISILSAVLAVPALTCAQAPADAPPPPEARPGQPPSPLERLERHRKAILEMVNEDQKQKLEDVFREALQQAQALQAELDKCEAARAQVLQKLMKLRGDLLQQLVPLLNDEQRAKLRDLMGQAGAMPGGIFQRLQENLGQLGLSDEQMQKIQKLRTDMRDRFAKTREQAQGDRQAMDQMMRETMQELRAKIHDILTPDQQEKLRGLMQQNAPRRPAPPLEGGKDPAPKPPAEKPGA